MSARAVFPTAVKIDVGVNASAVKSGAAAAAPSRLRPFRLRVFDAPEYRMESGFPKAVPSIDVRALTLVSSSGERVGFRPNPRDIITGASARWIGDANSFDTIAGRWLPVFSELGPVSWDSSGDYLPTVVDDYTYAVGKERFTVSAVNFNHDFAQHMWAAMTNISGWSGLTMIMVMSANSVYGSDETAGYSGIFGSGQPTVGSGSLDEQVLDAFQVRMSDKAIRMVTDRDRMALQIAPLLTSSAPFYLAVSLGRPSSVVYAGKGPGSMQFAQVVTGAEDQRYYGDFVLGRSFGDTLHTADMAVMEFALYADKLTNQQVRTEVALLSSVYGGGG